MKLAALLASLSLLSTPALAGPCAIERVEPALDALLERTETSGHISRNLFEGGPVKIISLPQPRGELLFGAYQPEEGATLPQSGILLRMTTFLPDGSVVENTFNAGFNRNESGKVARVWLTRCSTGLGRIEGSTITIDGAPSLMEPAMLLSSFTRQVFEDALIRFACSDDSP